MKTFSVNGSQPELVIDILAKFEDLSEEDVNEIYTLKVGESYKLTDLEIKRIT